MQFPRRPYSMIEEALLPSDGMAFGYEPLECHDCSAQAGPMIPAGDEMNVVRHDCQAEQFQFPGLLVDSKGAADRLKHVRVGERVKSPLLATDGHKERIRPVDPGWKRVRQPFSLRSVIHRLHRATLGGGFRFSLTLGGFQRLSEGAQPYPMQLVGLIALGQPCRHVSGRADRPRSAASACLG